MSEADWRCRYWPYCEIHRGGRRPNTPTTEAGQRCRYWPDCAIHRGASRPRTFSAENYAQMREDYADGITKADIARMFGAGRATVHAAVSGTRTAAPPTAVAVRRRR